jgi:exodeoxyribonuclease V gamma subunit
MAILDLELKFYCSNKLEELADLFLDNVYSKRTLEDFFNQELVLVQTQGMGVYLQQYIAKNSPIATQLNTTFLTNFTELVLKNASYEGEEANNETKEEIPLLTENVLFWKLLDFITIQNNKATNQRFEDYPEIKKYLYVDGQIDYLKCCQLAEKLATLFDQYQVYHYLDFANVKDKNNWQMRLLEELSKSSLRVDNRMVDFFNKQLSSLSIEKLPKRVSIFGVSSLAPLFYTFFKCLSKYCEVNFFYLNCSKEYWIDNIGKVEALQEVKFTKQDATTLLSGNPLLSSCGKQAQNFLNYLYDDSINNPFTGNEYSSFVKNTVDKVSFLSIIQDDILENIFRKKKVNSSDPQLKESLSRSNSSYPVDDNSIAIHACHNKQRQVEVLHDQILNFLTNKDIQPKDIIVMVPNIEEFEPYITAIFGTSRLQHLYTIADRNVKATNVIADGFFNLLAILTGKFENESIFKLLENPAIQSKFNLNLNDIPTLRKWVDQSGIRWGVNGEHHQQYRGEDYSTFSWKFGLDRMLLGLALKDKGPNMDDVSIIPFEIPEGSENILLGNFLDFLTKLFELRKLVDYSCTFKEWEETFLGVLDKFFVNKGFYQEHANMASSLREIVQSSENYNLKDVAFPFDAVLYLIEKFLTIQAPLQQFLRGKITFCSMVPMRSIPAKVIAVLGMNEDAFPRRESNNSLTIFDQLTRQKSLVRSKNIEDRYLFLELVLAARKHLLFFYSGMDDKTNKDKVMSTPLAELYDVLKRTFLEEEFLIRHKLQAFDQEYFQENTNNKLFSYSKANYAACKAFLARNVNNEVSLENYQLEAKGNVSDKEWLITPYEIVKFFTNPCEAFFNYAFNVRGTFTNAVEFDTDDILSLDTLQASLVKKELLAYNLQGIDSSKVANYLVNKGVLPLYLEGKKIYDEYNEIINSMPENFKSKIKQLAPKNIHLEFPNILGHKITISGPINVALDGNYYNYSFSSTEEKVIIPSFINFLLLKALNPDVKANYWIAGKPSEVKNIVLVENVKAKDVLQTLLELFIKGHTSCLPFFLTSSRSFYNALQKDDDEDKAFKAASNSYYSWNYNSGDKGDFIYTAKIQHFYNIDIFNSDNEEFKSNFKSISLAFYQPFEIINEA